MSAFSPHLKTDEDTSCFLIGPSAILDRKGEFDKSSHCDGIQSHSLQSSWGENEDNVGNDDTGVEVNPAAVDSASHNLPLLILHNLSLRDNLQDGAHSSLDPQQATHPAGVLPVGSSGRGRGQLKQTFQHYLSKRGVQSSGVGCAALNTGHEQKVWQKEETAGRQTAANLSVDQTISSDGRREETTPALLPTLVPSVDPKSESSCHGTESETELEPKPKLQAEYEMETESQTAMPHSFLFQLLEASHIGCAYSTSDHQNTSQEKPAELSEKNIASLQKKIGDLEVSKGKALLLPLPHVHMQGENVWFDHATMWMSDTSSPAHMLLLLHVHNVKYG